MRRLIALLSFSAALLTAAERPKIDPAMVAMAAQRLDVKLSAMMPADDPVQPVGLTQGAYIGGFGIVFMGSLNLAPAAGITPFHQSISKGEYSRIRKKKIERMPKLRQTMQDMLVNMAASLDTVPPDDQIAIAVSLFNFTGEDTTGIPTQIVARAQKRVLLGYLSGRANHETLASVIHMEEF